MALNSIMSTALTGLFTSQSALSVTSNNIANVNTPNYGREVVRQEAIVTGANDAGVKISGIERIVDQFLDTATRAATSDNNRYSIEAQFQDRLQGILGRPDQNTSLAGKIDSMFSNMAGLALDPGSSIQRQAVISGIDNFTSSLSSLSDQIQSLRTDASGKIGNDVITINAALSRIASLNPMIIKEKIQGHSTGALEGQVADALAQLSNLIDIRATVKSDGSTMVSTTNGVTLLDGTAQYNLKYTSPATSTAKTFFPPIALVRVDPVTGQTSPTTTQLDGVINSGELRGLLDLRDQILPGMADELGQLGGQFTTSINALHNSFTAFPAPSQLTGTNSGMDGTDPQNFTGKATFAVVDATGAVVNKTTMDFSALPAGTTLSGAIAAVNAGLGGAGTLALVNGVMSFTAANPANGVVVAQDATTPSSRGGQGFSQFFGMNDLVRATVPASFNTGVNGADASNFAPGGTVNIQLANISNKTLAQYTLTIPAGVTSFNTLLSTLNTSPLGQFATFSLDANGALVTTPSPGYSGLKVNVPSDSTARGTSQRSFSNLFGLGDHFKAEAASALGVVPNIENAPDQLALGTFNQTAAIGQVALTKGDQSGIVAYQGLQNTTQNFAASGNLSSFSGTLSQYGAAFLSNAGLMASNASGREQDTSALKTELDKRRQDVSGVNLDEELSNMIVYQTSYNASAKIISTVQNLYDALLSTVK